MDYLGSEQLAQRRLERRFPQDMIPESELEIYFAHSIVGKDATKLDAYIETHDRLDLLKDYGYARVDYYLATEPKK